jgi:GDP-L-fucose synthase
VPSYRRILVTGASGLLGSGLRAVSGDYADREFLWTDSAKCDLTDAAATAALFAREHPQAVLHFAARAGGIGYSMKRPATLLRDNVRMDLNVLEAARLAGVGKVVLTLSVGMYPARAPLPLAEHAMHDGPPDESNYSYAFAKRLLEPAIRAWRAEHGMEVIGLVANGIYGEHANFATDQSVMLNALIRRFFEHRHGNEPLTVWGDGTPLREYTYSQDLARAFMWCLDHYSGAQVLNAGTTEEHSIREIALLVAELLGIDPARIAFDSSRPSGVARRPTDNSRFVALSGFRYTPFRVGLERTVRWFCDNYAKPGAVRV